MKNFVQEWQAKHPQVKNEQVDWHFIGNLQTNKVKHVVDYVTIIQSVNRNKLVRTLHQQLKKKNKQLDILIQVNTSYEESKFGVTPEQTFPFLKNL